MTTMLRRKNNPHTIHASPGNDLIRVSNNWTSSTSNHAKNNRLAKNNDNIMLTNRFVHCMVWGFVVIMLCVPITFWSYNLIYYTANLHNIFLVLTLKDNTSTSFMQRSLSKQQAQIEQYVASNEVITNFNHNKNIKNNKIKKQHPIQEMQSDNDPQIHLVFSTGCNIFQDWQSFVFFYHAKKVKQPGHVTRIVSGCKTEQDEQLLLKQFQKDVKDLNMTNYFHLHITPDYSHIDLHLKNNDKDTKNTNKKATRGYKFYNKPFGMKHWMEHGLGFHQSNSTNDSENNSNIHDDTIIILLDPDQLLLQPFQNDYSSPNMQWIRGKQNDRKTLIQHGTTMAQHYGFSEQWLTKVPIDQIILDKEEYQNSPILPLLESQVHSHGEWYAAGPPYLATAKDMYQIVLQWTEFVPRVHEHYPYLLAEMFAYCLAAVHVQLHPQTASGFMVSDVFGGGGEGWSILDNADETILLNQACLQDNASSLSNNTTQIPNDDQLQMPYVVHYCHRYHLGKWFFSKYKLRKDFMSNCQAPLLRQPPANITQQYNFAIRPGGGDVVYYKHNKHKKREAFMLCTIISAVNEAIEFYKMNNCPITHERNLNRTDIFHDNLTIPHGVALAS